MTTPPKPPEDSMLQIAAERHSTFAEAELSALRAEVAAAHAETNRHLTALEYATDAIERAIPLDAWGDDELPELIDRLARERNHASDCVAVLRAEVAQLEEVVKDQARSMWTGKDHRTSWVHFLARTVMSAARTADDLLCAQLAVEQHEKLSAALAAAEEAFVTIAAGDPSEYDQDRAREAIARIRAARTKQPACVQGEADTSVYVTRPPAGAGSTSESPAGAPPIQAGGGSGGSVPLGQDGHAPTPNAAGPYSTEVPCPPKN